MPPAMNHQQRLLQIQQQQQQQIMRQQTIQQRQKEMQMEREKLTSMKPPAVDKAASAASAAIAASASKSAPALEPAKAAMLLKECDWVDKSLWASRQMLGGNAVNVFLRSTSNMQKIRRAKIRQHTRTKDKPKADEILTSEILNVKTAKRMKTEMEQGMQFCVILHDTVRYRRRRR